MTFFDTCIWIELVAANPPRTPREIRQATQAGDLLRRVIGNNEVIITCKEQLIEIVSAVQKYKMKEYNRNSRERVGNLKEFRQTPYFMQTQMLCRQVCDDMRQLAEDISMDSCRIEQILDSIHLVDINDFIYYEYCCRNQIDFYTFDGDFKNLGLNDRIHVLSAES